ncbi:hypothetical protein BCR34DRAFT_558971 [Clohesyomyces aquaticus]|uniref:Uncharacterized protein n=1 Tax=Clohesyomyces aquaticus TaxID=1231657 RepID=A0A1Y1ZYI5_9PLEO|nr:hypothetical protein BCR34DRAFT_558971 [Clohesyomyces aquaticus]
MMVAHPEIEELTDPLQVLRNAAVVGGYTGVSGIAIGAIAGTVRSNTPVLFAAASGIQCFTLGATYWGIRSTVLNSDGLRNWWAITRGIPLTPRSDLSPTPNDRVRASTIAGAITGGVLAPVFRGPRNIIPGTIMFGLFGFGGQHAYHYLDRRNTAEVEQRAEDIRMEVPEKEPWLARVARSKWSPMTVLSDEEYADKLSEQLLSVEAEIALVDERIAEFRRKQKQAEKVQAQKPAEPEKK